MKSRDIYQSEVKTKYGKGENYHTNLYSKLLCLITNKLATLDPFGVGIELEGGKTNWNDSVNGLPGLFGSSTCETLELKRLIQFLLNTNKTSSFEDILIPKEIMKFVKDLFKLLNRLSSDFNSSAFEYWNESANIKETFRAKVKFGIDGEEKPLTKTFINRFLKLALKKIECGLENAFDKNTGVLNSYFINEVETFDTVKNDTSEYIIPKKFRQIPTALFLEGPMHFIRTSKDLAREQYTAVKNSPLYDTKLKMYKVCESMSKMPKELGRCTVFSPGWLENESIFLHMEYKFLLETLKNKMYSEFFEDLKNAFVPYQDPEVYGRSILENSSFIVSSANTNENLHGTGFVARLSGSTAEFIHMWLYMNLGFEPFFLNNEGKLNFMLSPILPADFFSESTREVSWTYNDKSEKISLPKNHYAFVFLSNTLVIYENINLKNTYGKNACKVKSYKLIDKNGKEETFETEVLDEKSSLQIRKGIYKVIHVKLI
ncbi:MAG: hypothetical protein ACD_79C00295G0001 [uncultured bacterium]|nr:MAG: hypothetical protein ACD_79C00295G0001 [uncultured bacterium]